MQLLQSRKFWTALVGEVLVFFKVPPFSQVSPTVQVTVITAIAVAFILGTAIESGLERFGSSK